MGEIFQLGNSGIKQEYPEWTMTTEMNDNFFPPKLLNNSSGGSAGGNFSKWNLFLETQAQISIEMTYLEIP